MIKIEDAITGALNVEKNEDVRTKKSRNRRKLAKVNFSDSRFFLGKKAKRYRFRGKVIKIRKQK